MNKLVKSKRMVIIMTVLFLFSFFAVDVLADRLNWEVDLSDPDFKLKSYWEKKYPDFFKDGVYWLEAKPQDLRFILPDSGFFDFMKPGYMINQYLTTAENLNLFESIEHVFSSMKMIQMSQNSAVFELTTDFLEPIIAAVYEYVREYWFELLFTLGIAYVLVGLILRRFVWMMVRFFLILVFSGALMALFSPGYAHWDYVLKNLHQGINEHVTHILNLPSNNSGIELTGDYAIDIGNTLYRMNIVEPFLIGQFSGPVSEETAAEYFNANEQIKKRIVTDQLDFDGWAAGGLYDEYELTDNLIKERESISKRIWWTTKLAWVNYTVVGYGSILIDIVLAFNVLPLMLSLIFSSMPTDEALGNIKHRLMSIGKLLLGKLAIAFVLSVGTYANVYLLKQVQIHVLTLEKAQMLVIVNYLFTLWYMWKLTKWVFKNRDAVVNKGSSFLKGIIAGQIARTVLNRKSSNSESDSTSPSPDGGAPAPARSVMSKPAKEPIPLPPNVVEMNRYRQQQASQQGGVRSVMSKPAAAPIPLQSKSKTS